MRGYQKHHIVFKSQGGLDFDFNFAFLTPEQHTGQEGVHNNREMDLKLKKELQEKLILTFSEPSYSLNKIIELLGLKRKQAEKAFKRVACIGGEYRAEDIIRRLMGGKLY